MMGELNLGWSYYSELKSQFDFGVKYVPGIELNGFNDVGPLSRTARGTRCDQERSQEEESIHETLTAWNKMLILVCGHTKKYY